MDRSQFLFTLVDFFCEPFQNYKHFSGITKVSDVVYRAEDPKYCATDFYYKTELLHQQKLPVLVNIHGGGFVKGDKSHRVSLSQFYANEGYFVVNVNYRLSPKHTFPAALDDVLFVLSCLPDYAKKYDLDLDKVILTGDSAGAYYAAHSVAVLTNDHLRQALALPHPDIKVAGLMLFSGIYDIEKAVCKKLPFGLTRVIGNDFTGLKLKKDFSNMKEFPHFPYLATVDYVNDQWPQTLITYAEKDIFVAGQGESMVAKLRECGVSVTVDHTQKLLQNHCYHLTFFTKASKRCMEKVKLFLQQIKSGQV